MLSAGGVTVGVSGGEVRPLQGAGRVVPMPRRAAGVVCGSYARMLRLLARVDARRRPRLRGGVDRVLVRGLRPLACSVLLILAALPTAALASTNSATDVASLLPANAGTSSAASLGGVSCPSAGNCTAVGSYTDSSGHGQGLLLSETSGTWATGVEATLPANAGPKSGAGLASVSCPSAGNCTAVGSYTDSSGHTQVLALTEKSGTWARGVEVSLPANAGSDPQLQVFSVSCGAVGNCSAVGNYLDSSGNHQAFLLSETSGTWATGIEAALPADARPGPATGLTSVSCASAGNCTAVGDYDVRSGYSAGLLLTETSGTWGAGVEAPLPAGVGNGPFVELDQVSCASAGSCTAVGNYQDGTTPGSAEDFSHHGLLLSETSGTWATGVEASLPANIGTTNTGLENAAVSCASAGTCTAVGDYIDSSGHLQGVLLSETSGTWATGAEAPLPPNAGTNPHPSFNSVSCASAGNCTAVGFYEDSSGAYQVLVLTETSGSWAASEASMPANANVTNPIANLGSVSCGSAASCTAVGFYKDNSGHFQGLLVGGGSTLALLGGPTATSAGVTDKLTCAPSAPLLPCRATETLSTTETIQGGRPVGLSARSARTVIVGTKKVLIRPGRTVSVTVKLNPTGGKLLARFGKLPVTLTIKLLRDGRRLPIASTQLTVKPR